MNRRPGTLDGLRVLVLEDEMIVSLLVECVLNDHNCVVVGPYERLPEAIEAAAHEALDFALLDVNIAGVKAYPVAEILAARGIPFLFLSGYGQTAIPADHPDWQVCSKPFQSDQLVDMISRQLHAGN